MVGGQLVQERAMVALLEQPPEQVLTRQHHLASVVLEGAEFPFLTEPFSEEAARS